MENYYSWLLAGHVIFVIFWMAGMFMLPRFFAYHMEAAEGSAEADAWVDREKRLLKIIMTPSMIISWTFGLVLAFNFDAFTSGGWFHAKLTLVLLMSGFHGFLAAKAKKLAAGDRSTSSKRFRMLNEVPGVLIILIVILVEVRPF